jgi:Na+-translocating ferredoxin:NAD+ oxidoreductase RnfG subunit
MLIFKSNGGEVDVITGATLSSNSVLNIVRETTNGKIDLLN